MVDHAFLDRDGRLYPWLFRLEKGINRLPAAILTSSRQATELLQDEFDVPAKQVHPLPDCADTVRFNPENFSVEARQKLKQKLGVPLDRPIVAYLGLLTDYQGIPHLLQAAAKLKQAGEMAHFLIMGYPNVDHYKQLAGQHGIADWVTFTGKVEYRDAPFYLSLGDIAVAPKMSSTEGSGKLLNYMALAQPVVAYDSPVHREYLADLGVYAPLGDVAAFAEGIASLLRSPDDGRKLGQQLRQRAISEYSWQRAGEEIVTLYRRLTK
ncbi:MAG: glycosyltransferase family 4 protein [Anaerolineae bacterium]|nr:glycosyltransferase family 4 protein [Anaerolineae bacterium]